MELKNKVIVITGGTKGLGKALAIAFKNEGARVAICARDSGEIKKITEELGVFGMVADITNEEAVNTFSEKVIEKFNKIDVWINNAGVWMSHNNIEDFNSVKVHQMFDVNFFGTFYGMRSAIRQMKKSGGGSIINIISASALRGRPKSSAYSSSKWAVRGLSESVREEVKDLGISILAAFPYGIKTFIFDAEKAPADFDTYMEPEYVAKKIIENLKLGNPEENLTISKSTQ